MNDSEVRQLIALLDKYVAAYCGPGLENPHTMTLAELKNDLESSLDD